MLKKFLYHAILTLKKPAAIDTEVLKRFTLIGR
jgi:hypothetical protein